MSNKPHQFTTPVGRLVGGSLYEPRTTDYDGKPLVVKTGANAGKPRVEFSFGVAIPKTPGVQHWAHEQWGGPIYQLAQAAFPNGETQRADFAWKITDGDSQVPNKRGVKPASREGYPGHWVVWFSGGTAPRVFNANGTQLILEKDAVKPGYYVQVFGNAVDNKPSASPGLYINHSMVAFAAYGQEIISGPDVSQAGFGQGVALPAGALNAPPAGAIPATGAPVPPPGAAPVAIPPMPLPVPAPAPAAPVHQMTAKAGGATYEQMVANGWNDAMMIEQGYMVAPAASVPAPLPAGSVPTAPVPAPVVHAPPPSPVIPNPDMRAVPAAPARQMTPKANGATYEQMIAGGWNDVTLVQHGYMVA